jgi:hypothetical protein
MFGDYFQRKQERVRETHDDSSNDSDKDEDLGQLFGDKTTVKETPKDEWFEIEGLLKHGEKRVKMSI